MTKAYSYLRFSTPEQAQGDSRRRQWDMATAYAAANGLELDLNLTFRDLGVSGYSGANVRKGALGQFLQLIDEGLVESGSYLLVENLDRVSRQHPWDALPVFQQIINAGVTIVTLQDERVWSRAEMHANPFRMFESLMVMIRAHEESATKARRVRASWNNKRANADVVPLTSRGPAWLRLAPDRSWEVLEERAAIVRRIYEQAARGVGQASIAQALNIEGVPTWGDSTRSAAKHWHKSYIAKILTSDSVIGTYVPHTVEYENGRKVRKPAEPIINYYPAVVPEELAGQVRELQKSKSPKRGRHANSHLQNILGGLARCPLCGSTMTRTTKGNTTKAVKPYLVCTSAKGKAGCRYRAVKYDEIETALVQHAEWLEQTGPSGAVFNSLERQLADVVAQQALQKARVESLTEALAMGPSKSLREALDEAEMNADVLQYSGKELVDRMRMAEGPVLRRRLGDLKASLTSTPLNKETVNVSLRTLMSKVTVDYRSGFLVMAWKHGGETRVRYASREDPETVPERWRAAARFFANHFAHTDRAPDVSSAPVLKWTDH